MLKLGVRERDDGGRGKDKDIIFGGRCRGKKRKGRDITINIPSDISANITISPQQLFGQNYDTCLLSTAK